jgi:hypothetical protein
VIDKDRMIERDLLRQRERHRGTEIKCLGKTLKVKEIESE